MILEKVVPHKANAPVSYWRTTATGRDEPISEAAFNHCMEMSVFQVVEIRNRFNTLFRYTEVFNK